VSTRRQIAAAVLIALATYGVLLRIAEAKVESSVGRGGSRLDERRASELAAFQRERTSLADIGQRDFADRLEAIRVRGGIWVAPSLGADRWAVFAQSLRLVRRIYIRPLALLDPRAHLYPAPPADVPEAHQRAFAWIGLSGALRHELAHYDGTLEESKAYEVEIAWYEAVRASPWFAGLTRDKQRVFTWALDSAVLTAQRAARNAGEAGAR
jgi:hypothetical protein